MMTHRTDGLPTTYTHPRYWTEAERLRATLLSEEGLPDSAIARVVGRSENAVHVFASRHLRRKQRGAPGCRPFSGTQLGRMMGVYPGTAVRWVASGWLRGHRKMRTSTRGRRAAVQYTALLAFLENPEHWHRWRAETITEPELRRFVAHTRGGGNRYLTTGQVALRFHVGSGSVNDWIHLGLLPGARKFANWRIAESDLEGFIPPSARPRRGQPRGRPFSAAESAQIMSMRSSRPPVTWTEIAVALGRSVSAVHYRHKLLGGRRRSAAARRQEIAA